MHARSKGSSAWRLTGQDPRDQNFPGLALIQGSLESLGHLSLLSSAICTSKANVAIKLKLIAWALSQRQESPVLEMRRFRALLSCSVAPAATSTLFPWEEDACGSGSSAVL